MTENDEDAERVVSRRDMFKAGVMGAGLAAYASLGAEEAQASHTTPSEPLITLGDSFELFDSGDDAVIKHTPSGAHFTYNAAQSRWEMDAPLHLTSNDLSGVSTLFADTVDLRSQAFSDATADPSANGELQRNGTDLKAFSGGSVRNLSNIGSGGGATTLIESQSPSGVSSADFTTGIDSDHETYIFYLANVIPATDSDNLNIRTSTDGGSTWDSGSSDYRYISERLLDSGASVLNNSQGDSKILTGAGSVGNETGEPGITGHVVLGAPSATAVHTTFRWEYGYTNSTGVSTHESGSGRRDADEDVDGVRFLFSSGNIESGTIELIGVN